MKKKLSLISSLWSSSSSNLMVSIYVQVSSALYASINLNRNYLNNILIYRTKTFQVVISISNDIDKLHPKSYLDLKVLSKRKVLSSAFLSQQALTF